MNTKLILFASCVAAMTLSASVAIASPHGGSGGFSGGGFRGGGFSGGAHPGMAPGFARSGARFGPGMSGNFRNFHGDHDHFHHDHDFNNFVFFGGFGGPFFYPYPYYYGYYPYGYGYGYPYGYPYGYYPPYGYGYGSYGQAGYGYHGSAAGRDPSVAQMQFRLKRAGFYHGRIDGVMGPRTRVALREYQRSRNHA